MPAPVASSYTVGAGQPIYAGKHRSGFPRGATLGAVAAAGYFGNNPSLFADGATLGAVAGSGSLVGYEPPVTDDNLLNFNEGSATTGWSVTLLDGPAMLNSAVTAAEVLARRTLLPLCVRLPLPDVNKGIGGETSTQILARVAWVTAHSPRLVFLHASSNDEVQGVSAATRSSNIQSTINACAGVDAAVVLLNAMYGTSGNAINPDHRDYMDSWWGSDRFSITGLEAAINIMVPMDSGSNYMSGTLTEADGIHPTPAGYEAIGEYIAAEMP